MYPEYIRDRLIYLSENKRTMPKYLIEREIPGAGELSAQELQAISQKSCGVLNQMGPQIQWVQSYVTDDKIYCVYIAPNEKVRCAVGAMLGIAENSLVNHRGPLGHYVESLLCFLETS